MLTNGWVLDGTESDKVLAGTALGISAVRDESGSDN